MLKELGIVGIVIAVLIGLSILGFALKIIGIPFFGAKTLVNTNYEIIDKTLDADNVLYNYEWFKDRKEAIDANYQKIDIAKKAFLDFEELAGDRKYWTFEDKQEDSRLRAVAQGIESATKDLIAEYNARSQMANRNIFKDGLIPEVLEFEAGLIK